MGELLACQGFITHRLFASSIVHVPIRAPCIVTCDLAMKSHFVGIIFIVKEKKQTHCEFLKAK